MSFANIATLISMLTKCSYFAPQGRGYRKVKSVDIDRKNNTATINFHWVTKWDPKISLTYNLMDTYKDFYFDNDTSTTNETCMGIN